MTSKLAERARHTDPVERAAPLARAERLVPPGLRLMPERVAATRRVPFVLLVVSLLAAGLIALLLLNVALAQDSYRLHQLQKETSLLAEEKRGLQRAVALESQPSALAEKAKQQGMVPAGDPAYLDVSKGKARGKPEPAGGEQDGG